MMMYLRWLTVGYDCIDSSIFFRPAEKWEGSVEEWLIEDAWEAEQAAAAAVGRSASEDEIISPRNDNRIVRDGDGDVTHD